MGLAPEPGVGKRLDATETAKSILVITVNGEERRVAPNNLSFADRTAVRKETGLPLEAYWNGELAVGIDSVMVLWWIAGKRDGNTATIDDVAAQFSELGPDALQFDVELGGSDHPEA